MEKLTARTIRRWREECADGVHLRGMIFKAEWEALCDLALKGLAAPAPEVDASQEAKDAERYRKIKDRWSPFMVMYYGSLILGGNPDRRQVLTGELDELVDGWLEDGGGNQEWRLMLSSSAYGDKLIATSPLEPQGERSK